MACEAECHRLGAVEEAAALLRAEVRHYVQDQLAAAHAATSSAQQQVGTLTVYAYGRFNKGMRSSSWQRRHSLS